jgi:hypothetical protein
VPLRCFLKRRVKERDLTWKACFTIMLLYVVLILPTFVVRELLIVGLRGSCLKANGMCMDFTYIESDLHGSSGYDVVAKMIEKLYTDLSKPANLIPTYKAALMFDPGIFLAPIIQFQQVSQKTHFFVFPHWRWRRWIGLWIGANCHLWYLLSSGISIVCRWAKDPGIRLPK